MLAKVYNQSWPPLSTGPTPTKRRFTKHHCKETKLSFTLSKERCVKSQGHTKKRERQSDRERQRRNIMYMWKEREGRQQILKTKHNIFAIIYNLFWVYFVLNFSKEILLHYASQQSVMMYWNLVLWFCSGKWWNQ